MVNSFTLEGYVATDPVKKSKYEDESEYLRFDLVHYSKFGGSIKLACITTNHQLISFILKHISKDDRVIVWGSYNAYKYKDPAGTNKLTHSIVLNSYDSVKRIDVANAEEMIPKQKIGFPEGMKEKR